MKTPELEAARVRAIAFAERVRAADCCCTHGHFGCSDREGGFCLDEMFSRLGLDNDGEWIDAEPAIPADVKSYWLRITRGYCHDLTDEQADAVSDYAARSAMANPKQACGVWHAAHVVLKTPKCFCAKCKPQETFPVVQL